MVGGGTTGSGKVEGFKVGGVIVGGVKIGSVTVRRVAAGGGTFRLLLISLDRTGCTSMLREITGFGVNALL
jgi:hypothetical protein